MSPVRLALIGYGAWGRNYVKAARDSGEAKVTQVVLRAGSRAWLDRELYDSGVETTTQLEEINADAAIVAAGPEESPRIACELLRAGIDVLIEKPAGLSMADAEDLVRAENLSGALCLVGHQHLFAERYENLREEIDSHSHMPVSVIADWWGMKQRSYSTLWDYGPHAVAAVIGLGLPMKSVLGENLGGGIWRVRATIPGSGEALLALGPIRSAHGETKRAAVCVQLRSGTKYPHVYDGYDIAEPALTRQVRAFAKAVRDGGSADWRFGARWAVRVATVLEAAEETAGGIQ